MTIHLNDTILEQLVLGTKLNQQGIDKGYIVITELEKQIFVRKLLAYLRTLRQEINISKSQSTSFFKIFSTKKQGRNFLFVQRAILLLQLELSKYFSDEEVEKIVSSFGGSIYGLQEPKNLMKIKRF